MYSFGCLLFCCSAFSWRCRSRKNFAQNPQRMYTYIDTNLYICGSCMACMPNSALSSTHINIHIHTRTYIYNAYKHKCRFKSKQWKSQVRVNVHWFVVRIFLMIHREIVAIRKQIVHKYRSSKQTFKLLSSHTFSQESYKQNIKKKKRSQK